MAEAKNGIQRMLRVGIVRGPRLLTCQGRRNERDATVARVRGTSRLC